MNILGVLGLECRAGGSQCGSLGLECRAGGSQCGSSGLERRAGGSQCGSSGLERRAGRDAINRVPTINRRTNRSINRRTNRSINRRTNRSINRRTNRSIIYRFRKFVQIAIAFPWLTIAHPAQSAPRIACPTEIEPLITAMLPDLPGYANRIAIRERLTRTQKSSVITAGRPEFEPLPLNSDRPPDPTIKQAFITTLEREIIGGKAIDLQEFHWLFLTRTQQGWQLPLMFTRIGTKTPGQPITPPRDSRDSAIGRGIQQWLRDCDRRGIRQRN